MITQRERLGEVFWQGLVAAHVADPLRIGQAIEADLSGRALVAEAQRGFGKVCRGDRIADPCGKAGNAGGGPVEAGGGDRVLRAWLHRAIVAA